VAAAVMGALRKARIRAVLTGGACAAFYSGGFYYSEDVDVILQSSPSQKVLDDTMSIVGFKRFVDHFEHPKSRYFVEFPRGPLSIGDDTAILPVERRIAGVTVRILSPTDSCRDRLSAFYHWRDRQSFATAISIALRNRVDLRKIGAWSEREGVSAAFDEFSRELAAARKGGRRKTPGPSPRTSSRP
jgi:hypothetical protein